jgi:hypothetical protein
MAGRSIVMLAGSIVASGERGARISAVPAASPYSSRSFDRRDVELDHDPGVVTAYDDEVSGLADAQVELLMRHIRCEVDEITGGHFRDKVELLIRTIDRAFPPGTRVSRPDGGFVLWLQLPKLLTSRELFAAALKKGICFVPGDVFSASDRYANCLRVSCGSAWNARIEKGLATLGELAGALLARRPG